MVVQQGVADGKSGLVMEIVNRDDQPNAFEGGDGSYHIGYRKQDRHGKPVASNGTSSIAVDKTTYDIWRAYESKRPDGWPVLEAEVKAMIMAITAMRAIVADAAIQGKNVPVNNRAVYGRGYHDAVAEANRQLYDVLHAHEIVVHPTVGDNFGDRLLVRDVLDMALDGLSVGYLPTETILGELGRRIAEQGAADDLLTEANERTAKLEEENRALKAQAEKFQQIKNLLG